MTKLYDMYIMEKFVHVDVSSSYVIAAKIAVLPSFEGQTPAAQCGSKKGFATKFQGQPCCQKVPPPRGKNTL
jgi:hypothetical protein